MTHRFLAYTGRMILPSFEKRKIKGETGFEG